MKKKYVNEIIWLRTIACVSIVLLHSIAWGLEFVNTLSSLPLYLVAILDSFHIFLYYGTPTFIFITAFILGYSYKEKQINSRHFLLSRVKFILIPYFCMGVLYALPYLLISGEQFLIKILLNIFIGDFHAYFVLIIFQFYLLFILIKKWLDTYPPSILIIISLLINFGYLFIFNFINPMAVPFSDYIWERYYWVPFPGWIFYFTLAYYIGGNYIQFVTLISKNKIYIFLAPILTSLLVLSFYHNEFLTIHSSKRIDILFHTISIICLFFYITSKIKTLPFLVTIINKYSYGIYLIHTFYITLIIILLNYIPIKFGLFSILILFIGSIICSIITINFLNTFTFGKYIVGKVDVNNHLFTTVRSKLSFRNSL